MSDPIFNSETISRITAAEKKITGAKNVVKCGPTAQAQSHVGETINSQTLHDITEGEKKITSGERIKGSPTASAQSILAHERNGTSDSTSANASNPTGTLGSNAISKVTAAEKDITRSADPVRGGPTAQAQKHANEPINHDTLHDITEGEKKITGEQRPVAGGPTATAQSELAKSRC
ncbi:uncharacterized protein Z519_09426 [Cladophialophora bantiana CBS 173.52]|uniref:SMP domain-containing protein n=1 Tax=Cladophialophora bantiana (strain ATCC 10958 / CBS 173.52 / CDC B-1940 / NIH 8579) TaxID=1442370 RepID=A0A0D2EIZ9_CLAB1|nr:uncharacterized protein Z519_09426 [Cladophialophora bantiana CBS 173.52]KIW89996.1 hypothetical protein Z519_09426 [Cladophialophora bantiana CBS 173.52]